MAPPHPRRPNERDLLGYPIPLRAHVILFAGLSVAAVVIVVADARSPPIDSMIGDASALMRLVVFGTLGAAFVVTTALRLLGRATLVNYAISLFLSPWVAASVSYCVSLLMH